MKGWDGQLIRKTTRKFEMEEETKPKRELSEALKRGMFKPGDPRAKGTHAKNVGPQLRTILKKVLDSELDLDDPITRENYKMTIAHAIALRLVKRALEGNLKSIEMIMDRLEGKPGQSLSIGGIEDQPITVVNALQYDLSKLSAEELLALRGTLEKVKADDN